jgi:hypothetical protein
LVNGLLFLIQKFIAVIKSKKNTDKAKATSQAENVMVRSTAFPGSPIKPNITHSKFSVYAPFENKIALVTGDSRGIRVSIVHLNERNFNYKVRWDGVPTLKQALDMLTEQAKRTPEGQWVKVTGGWSPYQFKENRQPTIDELNKAVSNRPLYVQ